jgi:hypothetical protein
MYSSALNASSPIYTRTGGVTSTYYYEAIQVNVNETGTYNLLSSSDIDTYGYIYNHSFNPTNPFMNQLLEDDDGCANLQFKLIAQLQSNTTYILVVTTSRPDVTGAFSIKAFGLSDVNLKYISKYIFIILSIIKREALNS